MITKSKHSENFALNIWWKGYPIPSALINSNPDSLFPATDERCWYFPEIKTGERYLVHLSQRIGLQFILVKSVIYRW
jgi:hypothetical protein